jgi:hypothetical protein
MGTALRSDVLHLRPRRWALTDFGIDRQRLLARPEGRVCIAARIGVQSSLLFSRSRGSRHAEALRASVGAASVPWWLPERVATLSGASQSVNLARKFFRQQTRAFLCGAAENRR